jgi:hypothetical protein
MRRHLRLLISSGETDWATAETASKKRGSSKLVLRHRHDLILSKWQSPPWIFSLSEGGVLLKLALNKE